MKITKNKKIIATEDEYDLDSIDWYENYDSHPLTDLFYEALDKLGLEAEPSIQGGTGSDYFYDTNGETVGSVDYEDERSFMDNLAVEYVQEENPNDQKYVNAIADWLSEIIQTAEYEDDEVDEVSIDHIDNYNYAGGDVPDKLKKQIRSVVVAPHVKSISKAAFSYCTQLVSVTIPDSVTEISNGAFYNCTSLATIAIPNSVTSIGAAAFYECISLKSVIIGNNVTSIGDSAFYHCRSLTSINVPSSVTRIGNGVFSGCRSLTRVAIPDSVTSIGDTAFGDCRSLTSIIIPDSVTEIGELTFSDCRNLTSVTIGNNVTEIGEFAFSGCDDLTIYTNNPIAIEYAEKEEIPVVPLDEDLVTL